LHAFAGYGREGGAQRLVALDDGVEAALEGADVEGAAQADGGRHVVAGVAGVHLVEEPEAPLREGERPLGGVRTRPDGLGVGRGEPLLGQQVGKKLTLVALVHWSPHVVGPSPDQRDPGCPPRTELRGRSSVVRKTPAPRCSPPSTASLPEAGHLTGKTTFRST